MIDKELVNKLAMLSRVEIGEEEKISLGADLESILNYVSELSNVDGSLSGEFLMDDNVNIFREDVNPHLAGLYTDKIIAEVPRSEKGYILVKQVIGEKGERK